MNRVYTLKLAVCIYMMAALPRLGRAQCSCAGGVPATAISNTYTLSPTSQSSANLTFPQMNPSIGDLSCLTLDYKLSAQSITGARNLAPSTALLPATNPQYSPTGRLEYSFDLLTSANVSGPGFTIVKPYHTYYGPDSLGAYGQPDDSITYGPDNVLNGITGTKSFGSNAAYLGSGTVALSYAISGGLSTTEGGLNYSQRIQTTYWGDFTLTYYWCPSAPLATSITGFTATPQDQSVLLQWLTNNPLNNSSYEIQISTDGRTFQTIYTIEANPDAAAAAAKYQYRYNPDQADVGKLWFRIKEISPSGKSAYSQVALINRDGSDSGLSGGQVYPNPVTNSLVFRFSSARTGRYLLELVNTAGMVIQQKAVTLTAASEIRLDLNPQPAKGLYFLRTADLSHDQHSVSKVLIN